MGAYGQHRIQHKDALLGPLRQASMFWDGASKIIMKFLIDIHQGWRGLHTLFHGKAQPMGLSIVMVGILSQNHYLYFM